MPYFDGGEYVVGPHGNFSEQNLAPIILVESLSRTIMLRSFEWTKR